MLLRLPSTFQFHGSCTAFGLDSLNQVRSGATRRALLLSRGAAQVRRLLVTLAAMIDPFSPPSELPLLKMSDCSNLACKRTAIRLRAVLTLCCDLLIAHLHAA